VAPSGARRRPSQARARRASARVPGPDRVAQQRVALDVGAREPQPYVGRGVGVAGPPLHLRGGRQPVRHVLVEEVQAHAVLGAQPPGQLLLGRTLLRRPARHADHDPTAGDADQLRDVVRAVPDRHVLEHVAAGDHVEGAVGVRQRPGRGHDVRRGLDVERGDPVAAEQRAELAAAPADVEDPAPGTGQLRHGEQPLPLVGLPRPSGPPAAGPAQRGLRHGRHRRWARRGRAGLVVTLVPVRRPCRFAPGPVRFSQREHPGRES
jgi:hypothetical protein